MNKMLYFIIVCIICSCSHSPQNDRSVISEMDTNFIFKGDSIIEDSNKVLFDRSLYGEETDPYGVYNKPEGIVPDAETAVRICEAILFPIYGENNVLSQKPYEVIKVNNRYWFISGTLPKNANIEGGVFHIVLDKTDGKTCSLWHEK